LKWNLKDTALDVFEHRLTGPFDSAEEITALRNDGLASHQRPFQFLNNCHTPGVVALAPVQKGDDHSGVKEDRFHRPNPSRRFFSEPRSGSPDANRPMPTTLFREGFL